MKHSIRKWNFAAIALALAALAADFSSKALAGSSMRIMARLAAAGFTEVTLHEQNRLRALSVARAWYSDVLHVSGWVLAVMAVACLWRSAATEKPMRPVVPVTLLIAYALIATMLIV